MKHFLLFFLASLTCLAQTKYEVTASSLNIRSGSSMSSPVISTAVKGDVLEILSVEGEWGLVNNNGEPAYVCMKYLSEVSEASPYDESYYSDEAIRERSNRVMKGGVKLFLLIALLMGVIIFAIVQVQSGEMKVILGWSDLCLLLGPWCVAIFIILDFTVLGGPIFGIAVDIILAVLAVVGMIVSLILTITANWGHPFNVIYATLVKVLVFPVVPIGYFYIVYQLGGGIKNLKKMDVLTTMLLFCVIVGGLMSFDD